MSKMNVFISIILNFLFVLTLNAQDFKWGKPSKAEIELEKVNFEPDANAVVLYDKGNMQISYNNYSLYVTKRIKILAKAGEEEANVSIPYYKGFSKISNLKAQTLNEENGKIVATELSSKDFYDVDINQYWAEKRFFLTNVKPGSILEYQYALVSENIVSIDAWNFQDDLPKLYSEFTYQLTADYDYMIIRIGEELVKKYKNNTKSSTLSLTNISSYDKIKYVYNKVDQSERIKFQLKGYVGGNGYESVMSDWKSLVSEMEGEYNGNRNPQAVKKYAEQIPTGKDDLETLNNVLKRFKSDFRWDNFIGIYQSKSESKTLSDRNGSNAELNLLLNDILKAKNIKAEIGLVSSRRNGRLIATYPYIRQFNRTFNVVTIGNTNYVIDAAEFDLNQIKFPSLDLYNHYALLLTKGAKESFVQFNQNPSQYDLRLKYVIDTDKNQINVHRQDKMVGYFVDIDMFNTKKINESQFIQSFTNEILPFHFDLTTIGDIEFKNNTFYEINSRSQSDWKNPNFFSVQNPLMQWISNYSFEENERTRMIEFDYPYHFNIIAEVKIPAGYTVTIPSNYNQKILENPDLQYYQEARLEGEKLTLIYQFFLGKAIWNAEEYSTLKKDFAKIKPISNLEILIKKN